MVLARVIIDKVRDISLAAALGRRPDVCVQGVRLGPQPRLHRCVELGVGGGKTVVVSDGRARDGRGRARLEGVAGTRLQRSAPSPTQRTAPATGQSIVSGRLAPSTNLPTHPPTQPQTPPPNAPPQDVTAEAVARSGGKGCFYNQDLPALLAGAGLAPAELRPALGGLISLVVAEALP